MNNSPEQHVSAWMRVERARSIKRPTSLFFIERIFEDFIELKGDRYFADDKAIVGGIGWLDDIPVTVIGQEKGCDIKEKAYRNFGSPHPEGYRKALRLMKQAEKFSRPVICFVDTQGAFCGVGAEERGQGRAIADNLMQMTGLRVPIISIVIGEGGSGGALAIAVADRVVMLENSIYSILSPEGFASILWKDSSRAKEAAEVMKITAKDLKDLGVIDSIISEPMRDGELDKEMLAASIKEYIISAIRELVMLSKEELLNKRYQKFRSIGRL